MNYTDATDQVLAVLDSAGIQAWKDDAQYEALANAVRHAIAMHIRPTIAAKDAEIARLTGCLERANAQAEKFEREWYLRGDVLDATEYWLGSLLAVIHRDGGHYQAEHGMQKASGDAITAVHVLRGSLEGYVEANKYMKGELDDALEDARKYAEAQREIARLGERLDAALSQSSLFGDALHTIVNRCDGMANRIARAALSQESGR